MRKAIGLAVLSTLVRAWLAHRYFGFSTGDDAEIVQEAFRAAFALDYHPWAIRSLFASSVLVAPVLKLAAALGMHDPADLAILARYPFVLLGGVNVVLVHAVARRWCDERAALLATALYSVHWIPLAYGSSTFPRVAATTFVLLAVLLAHRAFAAGAAIALAFTMRFSEGVFLAPLLTVASPAWLAVCGFAAGALLLAGAFDWLTWGAPFASLIAFTRLTLVERASSSLVETQPPWWYLQTLPQWLNPALWPLLAMTPLRRRALAFVAFPVLALSAVHHKELRYLQVVIPFAMIAAAAGAIRLWDAERRTLAVALLVLAFPLQLGRIASIERRSMAAVDTARAMSTRGVKSVALSQVWAYGGRVYLGNGVAVSDLDVPPQLDRVRAFGPRVDCMAMYRSEITPEIREAAAGAGLRESFTFERDRSRAVEMLCR